jgi:PAS domain S-box/PAS domain S-box/PAS domain S-box
MKMKNELPKTPLQVLLVEDSPSDAALLQENLLSSDKGFSVSVVQSLGQALDHCKNNHPDAVLLDLTLPDSSGIATVRRAREHSPDLPIIVLTGVDDEKMGMDAMQAGVQDYLVKGHADGPIIVRAIRYAIERKKNEEALRDSEERFRAISEVSPVGIGVVGLSDRTFLYVNKAYIKAYGYSEDELLGRPTKDIYFDPADRDRVLRMLKENGNVGDYEVRLKRKDGSPFWASASTRPINFGGKPALLGAFIDITARKLMEDKLVRSREEWVETFNAIPDHIAILDNKHRIVRANKAMADKLGIAPEQIPGLPCYKCMHDARKPIDACPHSLMLNDRKQHIAEIHEDALGGEFLVSVTPIFDKNGELKGGVHVARDITDLKKKESDLHKLNRTLKALGRSSQAMMHAHDETRYLKEVCTIITEDCGHAMVWIGFAENDGAKSVSPVASAGFEEVYLKTLDLTWADTERGQGPTGTAIRTGKMCQCKNMLKDPAFTPWREEAKKRGYASSIALPLLDGGIAFGALTIYSREPDSFSEDEMKLLLELANDLTYGITMIRIQAMRKKVEDILQEERRFVDAVIQTTGGLIIGMDTQGRIKIFNTACEKTTGYTFDKVKDRPFWDFLLIPEEVGPVKEVFRNIAAGSFPNEFENYWVARDGGRRFIRWTNSAILNDDGKVELVIGTGIDITERKEAEEELKKTKNNLEAQVQKRTADLQKTIETLAVEMADRKKAEAALIEANEMKLLGQLTSGVAHEVRNPLNGIMAIMGALSKELSDNDRFQPYMQHMRNQVTRLTTLMEDLLSLGRPLRDENMQEVSMVTLVENALSMWLQTVQTSKPLVRFIKPEKPEECLIRAESTYITQMIINLLENASNHSPAGAEIVCSVNGKIANTVVFSVKDSGNGIPEENLPKIFDPFFTTRKGGTGLGLSIVRHIVENHEGSISAFNNADGPGATFEVVLPLYVIK